MTPFCLFFGLALIFQNIAESGASTGTSTSSNDILLRPMSEWTLIPSARLGDKAALWTKLAREAESREQGRLVIVSETLNGVTGVYKDKEKARPLGLEKAVMVNVIAFSGTEDSNSRYVQLLRNWFCYASHYGFQPVTYIMPTAESNFTTAVRELRKLGIDSHFLPFPEVLFWKLLLNKTTPVLPKTHHRANYEGTLPSFQTFGALVMLVPSLEVLLLGFDVVYFDLDLTLVTDPLPAISLGTADLRVSFEQRTCIFPSQWARQINWEGMEPNTGAFLAKATQGGVLLWKTFLQKVVDESLVNDQRALSLAFDSLKAEVVFDCNPMLLNMTTTDFNHHEANHHKSTQVRYCFLNEFIFQNGKMGLHCSKGSGGSLSEYVIGMHEHGLLISGPTDRDPSKGPAVILPAVVHANFCDNKIEEFRNLGLWLLDAPVAGAHCKAYDPLGTVPAKIDWVNSLKTAHTDIDGALAKLVNGSVVKLPRPWHRYVYLMIDGTLRSFPDNLTFEKMGYKATDIKYLGQYSFLKFLNIGGDLPAIK